MEVKIQKTYYVLNLIPTKFNSVLLRINGYCKLCKLTKFQKVTYSIWIPSRPKTLNEKINVFAKVIGTHNHKSHHYLNQHESILSLNDRLINLFQLND